MDYLILKFEHALWFPHSFYSKDKMVEQYTGRRIERKDQSRFSSPITVHQISNVLHVLMGQRPVSYFRKSCYTRNDEIFELAKDSFLKLQPYQWTTAKGDLRSIEETLVVSKGVHNSFRKQYTFTWSLIERIIGVENFIWFSEELRKNIKIDPFSLTPYEVLPLIDKKSFEYMFTYNKDKPKENSGELRDRKLTALGWFIISHEDGLAEKKAINFALGGRSTSLMTMKSIEKVVSLNGEIRVPLSNENREVISSNKGVASLLESGIVWIDSIQSSHEIDWDDFKNVGEISDKLISPEKK
jgi:hypothetical protein